MFSSPRGLRRSYLSYRFIYFQVDRAYIEDGFNLYGLKNIVPNYQASMNLLLDRGGACSKEDRMRHAMHLQAADRRSLPIHNSSKERLVFAVRRPLIISHRLSLPPLARHASSPDPEDQIDESEATQQSAMQLYGLIHARYIITTHGLDNMHTKFINGDFGNCPRALCKGQKVVPVRKGAAKASRSGEYPPLLIRTRLAHHSLRNHARTTHASVSSQIGFL